MRPGRKKALIILSVVLILTASAFLTWHRLKTPATVEPVYTVRVLESARSPYYLPQYLALNLGFYEEQNLKVNITTTSQEAVRNALADGRTDIALCGLQKIIFNPHAKDLQPKVFATMGRRDGSLLLSRKDAEDFGWYKLKDKTIIGGSHDDSSGIALEEVLRRYDLPPYRKVIIYYNIPESLRLGAFRAGTGHYIQLLEPDAPLAESKGYGQVVASVGEATGDMTVTAYAALPGYVESKPEVIQRFTNAIYKAQLWLSRHSVEEAAIAVAPSFPNLDYEVLLKCIERYRAMEVWAVSPVVTKEAYEAFHAAAKNAGEIAAPVPYETTVVTDFARQALETVVYEPEVEKEKKKTIFDILKS